MKAKKLPSGNWRARAYDNETKKCKSFTAETKKEAELMALKWLNDKKRNQSNIRTVGECIDEYIAGKENILSPTSIASYRQIKRCNLAELCDIKISELSQNDIQNQMNRLPTRLSPKTVRNTHGFLMSVLNIYAPDLHINTTLPKKQKKYKTFPKVEDVFRVIKGTEIELPCMLALWEGLRMSEIRGIRKSDIKDGVLTIQQVIVTVNGKHITKKQTKTTESTRQLRMPQYILELIDKQDGEMITELTGQAIGKRFSRLLEKNGLEHISFHDLRHLNASVMLMLGIPDKYAMERGGWSSPNIMKSVYQHTFSDERIAIDKKIDDFFENLTQNPQHN